MSQATSMWVWTPAGVDSGDWVYTDYAAGLPDFFPVPDMDPDPIALIKPDLWDEISAKAATIHRLVIDNPDTVLMLAPIDDLQPTNPFDKIPIIKLPAPGPDPTPVPVPAPHVPNNGQPIYPGRQPWPWAPESFTCPNKPAGAGTIFPPDRFLTSTDIVPDPPAGCVWSHIDFCDPAEGQIRRKLVAIAENRLLTNVDGTIYKNVNGNPIEFVCRQGRAWSKHPTTGEWQLIPRMDMETWGEIPLWDRTNPMPPPDALCTAKPTTKPPPLRTPAKPKINIRLPSLSRVLGNLDIMFQVFFTVVDTIELYEDRDCIRNESMKARASLKLLRTCLEQIGEFYATFNYWNYENSECKLPGQCTDLLILTLGLALDREYQLLATDVNYYANMIKQLDLRVESASTLCQRMTELAGYLDTASNNAFNRFKVLNTNFKEFEEKCCVKPLSKVFPRIINLSYNDVRFIGGFNPIVIANVTGQLTREDGTPLPLATIATMYNDAPDIYPSASNPSVMTDANGNFNIQVTTKPGFDAPVVYNVQHEDYDYGNIHIPLYFGFNYIKLNEDEPQRSMIHTVTITLPEEVTFGESLADAFEMRHASGATMPLYAYYISFPGNIYISINFGPTSQTRLPDGRWVFKIKKDKLFKDNKSIVTTDVLMYFHTLFGDVDGDGDVDNLDYFALLGSFGKRTGDPGFRWELDYNFDTFCDTLDQWYFNQRFGTNVDAPQYQTPPSGTQS